MDQWTPDNIATLIAAITGLITAIGAIIHSRNTRKQVDANTQAIANANPNNAPAQSSESTNKTT